MTDSLWDLAFRILVPVVLVASTLIGGQAGGDDDEG